MSDSSKLIEAADVIASVLLVLSGLFYGAAGVFRIDVLSYIGNPMLIRLGAILFGVSSLYVGARLIKKYYDTKADPILVRRPGLLG